MTVVYVAGVEKNRNEIGKEFIGMLVRSNWFEILIRDR
jgi:hypothetical protein